MSEEAKDPMLDDPFAIFGTKVEDITSYEEREARDWSKTFLELDPDKGDQTVLVKLCPNVFDPKDSLPKRYTYKLPYPDNAEREYSFVSPSTVGKPCPVMELFWELNRAAKKGDAVADAKKKNLARKRNRAVYVQIINDLKNPSNNGQFRLLRFPEGMDLDNLIASKINPSEDERKLGTEPVNVFDPFSSPLLILRCTKGQYGRDFSKSSWAPDNKNHGNMVPAQVDEAGNVVSYRTLKEEDRNSPDARKHLEWIITQLKNDDINMKEQWMYKDPDEETLKRVKASLELINTGQVSKKEESTDGTNKLEKEATPTAATQTPAATETAAPAAEKQPEAPAAEPAPAPAVEAPKPAAAQNDDDLMKELGL